MPNWNNGQNNPDSAPVGADEGSLWWHRGTKQLKVYDGTSWISLNAPGSTLNATQHVSTQGDGFTYIAAINGTAGNAPNLTGSANGRIALAFDIKNLQICAYDGAAWHVATMRG